MVAIATEVDSSPVIELFSNFKLEIGDEMV
jgi:hypothetical protein